MFNVKSSILIGSSLLIGGISVLVYELQKPRNVKSAAEWKGIKLTKEEDDFTWKALFFEKQNTLKEKSLENDKDLKDYCLKLYKRTPDSEGKLVADAESFCSGGFITRKARIKAGGFEDNSFLKEEADFKVAFALNKYTEEFRDLLSEFSGNAYTDKTESVEAWKDYKIFCDTKLDENEDTDLEIIQKVCEKKGFKTAKEKIEKEGRVLLKKEEFEKQFEELKKLSDTQGNTLLEDIQNEMLLDNWKDLKQNKETFKTKLEEWCKKQEVKELSEEKFYPDIYSRFRTRCTKEKDFVVK